MRGRREEEKGILTGPPQHVRHLTLTTKRLPFFFFHLSKTEMPEENDLLSNSTEGICWHRNNYTKSHDNGLDKCGIPEFLKVTLKRASASTTHRGLCSSSTNELESETEKIKIKETFEGRSHSGNYEKEYIKVTDFGDGLIQKLRHGSMTSVSNEGVSINVGELGDSTNCITDYGDGAKQKMEKGSLKDIDGTANFSITTGEGRKGTNHMQDFGDGKKEKIEAGFLKPVQGTAVSLSEEETEMKETLRTATWMTRDQLESFVLILASEKREAARETVFALVDAVCVEGESVERLVDSMSVEAKREFVERATASMSETQVRSCIVEFADQRRTTTARAISERMSRDEMRVCLQEAASVMTHEEMKTTVQHSVNAMSRNALETVFNGAAAVMNQEEFEQKISMVDETRVPGDAKQIVKKEEMTHDTEIEISKQKLSRVSEEFRRNCSLMEIEVSDFKQQLSGFKEESASFQQMSSTFHQEIKKFTESRERFVQQETRLSRMKEENCSCGCFLENVELRKGMTELKEQMVMQSTELLQRSAETTSRSEKLMLSKKEEINSLEEKIESNFRELIQTKINDKQIELNDTSNTATIENNSLADFYATENEEKFQKMSNEEYCEKLEVQEINQSKKNSECRGRLETNLKQESNTEFESSNNIKYEQSKNNLNELSESETISSTEISETKFQENLEKTAMFKESQYSNKTVLESESTSMSEVSIKSHEAVTKEETVTETSSYEHNEIQDESETLKFSDEAQHVLIERSQENIMESNFYEEKSIEATMESTNSFCQRKEILSTEETAGFLEITTGNSQETIKSEDSNIEESMTENIVTQNMENMESITKEKTTVGQFMEKTCSKERLLSWKKSQSDQDEDEGISWHHINYQLTAQDDHNQPEFLKAKLKRTNFGVEY